MSTDMPDIQTKRVYEPAGPDDGFRVLVDRVWPRGTTKADVGADLWLKDAAPSTELRKWYGHDPAKWDELKRRYFAELDDRADSLAPLWEALGKGRLTLLYSSREPHYNQATVLKEYLTARWPQVSEKA
ncbi:MAG: DUF488 domain-containing protein [Pseudomonadota bacterium]